MPTKLYLLIVIALASSLLVPLVLWVLSGVGLMPKMRARTGEVPQQDVAERQGIVFDVIAPSSATSRQLSLGPMMASGIGEFVAIQIQLPGRPLRMLPSDLMAEAIVSGNASMYRAVLEAEGLRAA